MHLKTQQAPTGSGTVGEPLAEAATAEPSCKLVRLPIVESLTGLKRSSIYKAMRERTFPGSVSLSARAVAWRESEVLAWIAARTKTGGANDGA